MFETVTAEIPFGANPIKVENGRWVKQADGAVFCSVGGTTIMAAVTVSPKPREGMDFFPLMVDYREKFYASGRIPGGFFKREGRPGDTETLFARITDRAIRPLFPDGMRNEVMVYLTLLASDQQNPGEVLALNATSIALQLSSIPFSKPIAAVRIGRIEGELILNPTMDQIADGDLNLVVAGTKDAINMVESGAKEVTEEDMIAALEFAHNAIKENIAAQEAFVASSPSRKKKFEFTKPELPAALAKKLEKTVRPMAQKLCAKKSGKEEFSQGEEDLIAAAVELLGEDDAEWKGTIKDAAVEILSEEVRELIIKKGKRVDGRKHDEIRPIHVEHKILPSVHGSAVFTRGETQALGVVTLGTIGDAQMIDNIYGTHDKFFMLQYNFPPFSVGEAKPMRAPGRREIGHGALAERALEAVMPTKDKFPYTVRMVSEILESNGSSSMATVCVSSLAMMDAGVPLSKAVAGIAMGLVANAKGETAVLTDIQGVEDHLGDMDFKVAGTRDGITALQMDIKIEGITFDILKQALTQAKAARFAILDKMDEVISSPGEMAPTAPRVETMKIPSDKIGALIGPGGKNIRALTEETGTKIDVEEDGTVFVAATNGDSMKEAMRRIEMLTKEIQIGEVYKGKVVRVTDFGAFIELMPGRDGMLHVSEMAWHRVEHPDDFCKMGDEVEVKVVNIDPMGKVRLSHKQLTEAPEGYVEPSGGDRGPRGGGDRGGRGGDRGGRGGDRGGRSGGDRGGRGGGDRDRGPRGGGGGERGGGDRGPRRYDNQGGEPSGRRTETSHESGPSQSHDSGPAQSKPEGDAGEYSFRERPRQK